MSLRCIRAESGSAGVERHRENEQGLCHLPNGTAYYEQIVREETGSERTVEEMEDLTRRQIVADLEAMEEVLGSGRIHSRSVMQMKVPDREMRNKGMRNKGMLNRKTQDREMQEPTRSGKHSKKKRCGRTGAGDRPAQVEAVTAPNPVSILKQLEEGIKNVFRSPQDECGCEVCSKSDGGNI